MAIPPFQQFMLPIMQMVADGQIHAFAETKVVVAKALGVSSNDLQELLPSGRQTRFENRIYWAKVHLEKALLLESPTRGKFRITDRGRKLLGEKPNNINLNTLAKYPEWNLFKNGNVAGATLIASKVDESKVEELTPTEQFLNAYQSLREQLGLSLLDQVMKGTPEFFELLVVDLLLAMGYGGSQVDAGKAVGKTSDGGIDGIIKEDRLGLDFVYLQAKRWERSVGSPEVRDFVGSLVGHSSSKGVFLTTSKFSKEALDYVKRIPQRVVLIDGAQLTELMMDFCVGVTKVETYSLQKMDTDYFGME